jgi:thioredoxin reductase
MRDEEHHDLVVIGGGPAGVSCALECFDIQLDTVLFETHRVLGGQLVEIPHRVRNVAAGRVREWTRLAAGARAIGGHPC